MTDYAGSPAAHERQALVEALQQAGAEADTLCEGWNARDLAVHVVARDARPHTVFGQDLPVLGEKAKRGYQEFEELSFHELVRRIRAGVPQWSPARLRRVDNAMNTLEFFVHTEDVLRAGDSEDDRTAEGEHADDAVTPRPARREIPDSVRNALWAQASRTLLMAAARKARRRITFLSPGWGAVTHGRAGDPVRLVEGPPEELVLWAFGRQEAAEVSVRRV